MDDTGPCTSANLTGNAGGPQSVVLKPVGSDSLDVSCSNVPKSLASSCGSVASAALLPPPPTFI